MSGTLGSQNNIFTQAIDQNYLSDRGTEDSDYEYGKSNSNYIYEMLNSNRKTNPEPESKLDQSTEELDLNNTPGKALKIVSLLKSNWKNEAQNLRTAKKADITNKFKQLNSTLQNYQLRKMSYEFSAYNNQRLFAKISI